MNKVSRDFEIKRDGLDIVFEAVYEYSFKEANEGFVVEYGDVKIIGVEYYRGDDEIMDVKEDYTDVLMHHAKKEKLQVILEKIYMKYA